MKRSTFLCLWCYYWVSAWSCFAWSWCGWGSFDWSWFDWSWFDWSWFDWSWFVWNWFARGWRSRIWNGAIHHLSSGKPPRFSPVTTKADFLPFLFRIGVIEFLCDFFIHPVEEAHHELPFEDV